MIPIQRDRRLLKIILCAFALCANNSRMQAMTMYSRQDPYPVYSTLDPQTFIDRRYREQLLQNDYAQLSCDRAHIAITPFGQNANEGKNLCGQRVELGDLNGRWFMPGLLYGPVPEGKTLPAILGTAKTALFDVPADTVINDCQGFDSKQLMGFFSVPLNYRKRGVRFQIEAMLSCDVGIRLEGGLADIWQSVCPSYICPCPPEAVPTPPLIGQQDPDVHCAAVCATYINETNKSANTPDPLTGLPNMTKDNVNKYLMCPFQCNIAPVICIDIDDYHKLSAEDIRLGLFWRHDYVINDTRSKWPEFLFIPFAIVQGSFPASKRVCPDQVFAVSAGNNGHYAIGAACGMSGEFATSVEFGWEFGYTHFFAKDVNNMPMPTSCFQQGIYPFCANTTVQPGANWNFGAKMSTYHFLERLSFFFEYMLIIHEKDSIKLRQCDAAFLPKQLEETTVFKTQVANVGFNYDISPNIGLGFLWQAPLQQQVSYRSTTIMFGFNATF